MAAPTATPSAVPEWVRRNDEIFRTPPSGMDLSKRGQGRSLEAGGRMVEQAANAGRAAAAAAMARAEMSEDDGLGSIDPPAFLPPASYYKDVSNHANIAATMLVTARHQVGFEPGLVGQELTPQQMDDFVNKFYKWIFELDNYWPYIDIKASQTMALWFHSVDQNVSQFLASFGGSANEEVVEAWRQALTGLANGAAAYVSEHGGNVSTVSFQADVLDTSGKMNPALPLTFGRTVQSSSVTDSVLTNGMMYRVDSNAIIAAADQFAQDGVTIFGAREYVAYVNNTQ